MENVRILKFLVPPGATPTSKLVFSRSNLLHFFGEDRHTDEQTFPTDPYRTRGEIFFCLYVGKAHTQQETVQNFYRFTM